MQNHRRIALAVSAALGLTAAAGLPSGIAYAQQAQAGPQGESAGGLEEVVVTAERRSEDVQTTPIALTAVSGADLAANQEISIADLQVAAPSFSVNTAGQYQSINIRGIGNAAVNPAIVPGIAVFRDGLFLAETIGLSEPFYDIADAEVLRGPQGTFIGQSSTGGAVLINSVSPTFDGVNGFIDALVGNYTDVKTTGAVNLPINDVLAMRIAFNVEHRNSFYKDLGSDLTLISGAPLTDPGHLDDRNIRLSLLFKPTDKFQALLKIEDNLHQTGGTPYEVNQNAYTDPATGAQLHTPFYPYSTHIPFVLNMNQTDLNSDETQSRFGLETKYTFDSGVVLRTLTGFQHIDIREINDDDGTSANQQWDYHLIGPDDNYESEEINIISPANQPLTYIAGASWFYRNTPVNDYQLTNSGPPYPTFGQAENPEQEQLVINAAQRTMGVFGQLTYQFTDQVQAYAGARENWDNNFNNGSVQLADLPGAPPSLVLHIPLPGHFHDSVPTWKVGVNYTPWTGQFLYAFVARGYKSGGVNAGSPQNFDPEHVTDYELGWKGKLLDGHIETQLGGYYNVYQDLQQPVTNPVTGGGGITNVGQSTIKGIEAGFQAHLAGFNFNAGVSYNETALGAVSLIATYRLPPLPGNTPQCVGGETTGCFNYTPYIVNLNGGALPFSPKVTADVSADYGIPFAGNTLRPRVTFTHVDKQFASLFQSDNFFLMNARNLLGANVTYEAGPWRAEVYGTNLTNEVYVSAYNGTYEFYGNPRQYGLEITRRF
jgi:iron complex outermembrane receptor protein